MRDLKKIKQRVEIISDMLETPDMRQDCRNILSFKFILRVGFYYILIRNKNYKIKILSNGVEW